MCVCVCSVCVCVCVCNVCVCVCLCVCVTNCDGNMSRIKISLNDIKHGWFLVVTSPADIEAFDQRNV